MLGLSTFTGLFVQEKGEKRREIEWNERAEVEWVIGIRLPQENGILHYVRNLIGNGSSIGISRLQSSTIVCLYHVCPLRVCSNRQYDTQVGLFPSRGV